MEEEDLHFYTLIDVSPSMQFGSPTKFQYAKQLAGALGYIGLCRADRVKIEALDGSRNSNAPTLRGRSSLWQLVDHLERMESQSTVTMTEAVKAFACEIPAKAILVASSPI